MARLARQPPTAVAANVFGGAGSLVGSFILAERCQVEDARCWSDGPLCNVQAVVNATHDRHPYHYPDTARSQVGQWVVLNARGNPFRNNDILFRVTPGILEVLRRGGDVLVHCNQSFHRGPVACAALFRRCTGHSAQAGGVRRQASKGGESAISQSAREGRPPEAGGGEGGGLQGLPPSQE